MKLEKELTGILLELKEDSLDNVNPEKLYLACLKLVKNRLAKQKRIKGMKRFMIVEFVCL